MPEEAQDPTTEEVDANAEGGFSTQLISTEEGKPTPEQEDVSAAKTTDQAEQRSPEQIKFDTKFQALHGKEQAARVAAEKRLVELEAQLAPYTDYSAQDRAFVEKRRELAQRDPELHDQLFGEIDPSLTRNGQTADARTRAIIEAELAPIKHKQQETDAKEWARGVVQEDQNKLLEAGFDWKNNANADAKAVLKAMAISKVGGIENMTEMYTKHRSMIDKISGSMQAKTEMQQRIGRSVATAKGSDHIPKVTGGQASSLKEAISSVKEDFLKEVEASG